MTNRELIRRLRKILRLLDSVPTPTVRAGRQLVRELHDDLEADDNDDDTPERVTRATWAQALDQGGALDGFTRVERGVTAAAMRMMTPDGVLTCAGAELASHAKVAPASATTARRSLAAKGWLVELPPDEGSDGRLRSFAASVPASYALPEEDEST